MRLSGRSPIVALLIGVAAPAWAVVPTTPANSDPANGVWANWPDLYGSAYADPDGSPQVGAEFQVRTSTGVYGDASSMGSGTLGITTSWTAPTATRGVTYFWHLRYRDAEGWSAWSAETSFTYDDLGPTTPPSITVGPTATTGVFTLSWGTSTDGNSGVFGYDVESKQFPTPYQYVRLFNTDPEASPPVSFFSPQTCTLGPGTYTMRVRAVDGAHNHSSWLESTPSFTVVANGTVPVLAAPAVTPAISNGTMTVTWTAGAGATGYILSQSTDSGATWRQLTIVPATSTTYAYSPWTDATYLFRIAVATASSVGAWSGTSAPVLYDVTDPDKVTNYTVTPTISNGPAFTLNWTDAGDPVVNGVSSGVARFNVGRAPQGSSTWIWFPDVIPPAATLTNTPPSDGRWQYRVRAVDSAGNTGSSGYLTVTRDTVPPSAPGRPSASASPGPVALTWTAATDATSGVASYALERSTDGVTFTRIATGIPTNSTSDAIGEGRYWYRVAAVDAAGWEGPLSPASLPILVDATAPLAPTAFSATPALSGNGQLQLAWTANGDPTSGGVSSGIAFFELQRAPAGTGAWVLLGVTPVASPQLDAPADGAWVYQVRAVDAAGNRSGWTATATATADTTPPLPPGMPTPIATVTNASVSLTWAAALDATSGVASYDLERSADGGITWMLVASGIAGTATADAAFDGRYLYRVLAVDVAGHTSAPSLPSVEVLVDRTAPSIPASPSASPSLSSNGQLTVSWTSAGDPLNGGVASGVARFELRRAPGGTGIWTALGPPPPAPPVLDTPPSDGDWDYQVRAVDLAGNSSGWSATATARVDTAAPGAPGAPLPTPTVTNGTVSLSWTAATDATSSIASYDLQRSADAGATWVNAGTGISGTSASDAPSSDGRYVYRVRATDAAGHQGAPSPNSAAVVIDKTAPSVPTGPALAPALSGDGQLTLSWTNAGDPPAGGVSSGVARFEIQRSPGGANAWTTLGTSPPASPLVDTAPSDGNWDYQVRAVDAAGNRSAWSATATARVDRTPPGAPGAPVPSVTLTNGSVPLSWIAAADATSSIASYDLDRSADNGATWASAATGISGLSASDAPADGRYVYRVKARDAAGNLGTPSTASVAIVVDKTAPSAPTAPAASPAISGNGQLTLSWTDAGDPLTGGVASGVARFELRRAPGGTGTWTLLGTSPAAPPLVDTAPGDGYWDYQVRAVDAAGNVSAWSLSATGRVDTAAPGAPGAPVPAATLVNGPVSLSWTAAADATSGIASYTLLRSGNGGTTWGTAASAIAGTSTADAPSDGQYVYRVMATDLAGHAGAPSPSSVQVVVDLTAPSMPVSPAVSPAVSADGLLAVSWTDNGDPVSGGVASGVARFQLRRSPGGTNTWTALAASPTASPLTDTAPADGTWDYQVRAIDAAGNSSAWSATASASVNTSAPGAPGAPVPSATTYAGPVSLTWAPPGGGVTIASYSLERSADNGVTWTSAATGLPTPSAADAPADGQYRYRVLAIDTVGHPGPYSPSSVQILVDTVPPSAAGAPVPALAITRASVSLSWTAAADATSGVSSYSLERSPDLSAWTVVASGIASVSTADAAPEGAFYYRVAALDGAANRGPASPASVRVIVDRTPPQAPAAPTAGPTPSAGPVTVSWIAVADVGLAGLASYRVERSPDGAAWTSVAAVPSTATVGGDTPPSGTWLYRVVAIDAAGNEAASPPSAQPVQVDSTPARLVFATAPSQVLVGECVPLAIQTRSALDVPAAPAADLTVALGGSASVSLFSDGACTTPASSVVIAAGTTQAAYSWSSSAAGTATLTGTAPPLASASRDYPVVQIQGGSCSANGECATGVCADSVCCNVSCSGGCESCAQAGNAGKCLPWAEFSDPEGACGTGACAGTCDGAGACRYPGVASSCGTCRACDGTGTCAQAQDGASCADSLFCNGAEQCVSGVCQAGAPVTCPPSGRDVQACDEALQSCQVQSQSPPVIVHDAHPDGAVGVPYAYNAAGAVTVLGARPMTFASCGGPAELRVEPRTGAVSFIPTAAGTVPACVQATNAYGMDSYSFTIQVAPDAPGAPVARITAANAEGIAPLTATLDGSGSTSADGSPLHAWRWREGTFGRRRFTAGIDAHYLLPGGYLGELQVVDRAGRTGSAVQAISALTSQGHRPPAARVVASALRGDNALEVDLSCDCTPGDNPIRAQLWHLSTGETRAGASVHVSLGPGRHHVLLEVVDGEGLSAFAKQELVVTSAGKLPPDCEVTADPPAALAPAAVTYEAVLAPSGADIASLELRTGAAATDQPSVTLQENTPGRIDTSLRAVDADGLACADVGLVRIAGAQSRLPPAILSRASAQGTCGISYAYGATLPVVAGTGGFGFSVQGAPQGLTADPATGEIHWTPTSAQAGPHDFKLVASNATGSASEDIHVEVACGPAAELGVACGCNSADGVPLALAVLAVAQALWRRRRSASPRLIRPTATAKAPGL